MIALATAGAKAQHAITFVGGSMSNGSGSISLSCGETAVKHSVAKAITVVNITSYFTEGVQQGFADQSINITSPLPIDIAVGPNPTHDWVEISVSDAGELNGLKYTLFSVKGETIKKSALSNEKTQIDLSALPAGTYLLHIASERTNSRNVYKIIKAN